VKNINKKSFNALVITACILGILALAFVAVLVNGCGAKVTSNFSAKSVEVETTTTKIKGVKQ